MNTLEVSRGQVLVTIGVTAIILWSLSAIGLFSFHLPLISIQLNIYHLVAGIVLGILISSCSLVLYQRIDLFRRSADANLHTIVDPLQYQDLAWLGLLPGLSEELFFRGILLPTIGLNWLGIIVSSLIFGLLHLSHPRYYIYGLWAICVGIIFASVTLSWENLLISIVAHCTTNILSAWFWKSQIEKNS